jgi:hypothetical protein
VSAARVGAGLRRLVFARAAGFCEYCLLHEEDTFFGCEVDHVMSRKHGGETDPANLALACVICNRRKGSDVGSILPGTDRFVRLYHPRRDTWTENFALRDEASVLHPVTDPGTVTVHLLQLDTAERRTERHALARVGRYPPGGSLLKRFGAGLGAGG